jgi:hypothetical protein
MYSRSFPFFLGTNIIGYPAGDSLGLMNFFFILILMYSRIDASSFSDILYIGLKVGCFPSSRTISWS